MRCSLAVLAIVLACAPKTAPSTSTANTTTTQGDDAVRRVVTDYVGLWRRETLPQWHELFLPSFTVASTNADGTTTLRTRDEFFAAQQRYHERVAGLREDLENIRIERTGRLASVWADFIVTDSGDKRRGKLVLLLIEERGVYKIHSLMFTYHA